MKNLVRVLFVLLFAFSAFAGKKDKDDTYELPDGTKVTKQARKGGGSDGGQFDYFYTSMSHFYYLTNRLSLAIENSNPEELELINKKYQVNINWKEFAQIILTSEPRPSSIYLGINPLGMHEPKLMNYDLKKKKIIVLQTFFQKFNKAELSPSEALELHRSFLHEASHLYGIGIDNASGNNDGISRAFAADLYKAIYAAISSCGLYGNIELRLQNCQKIVPNEYLHTKQLQWYTAVMQYYKVENKILPEFTAAYYEKETGVLVSSNVHVVGKASDFMPNACSKLPDTFKSLGQWRLPNDQEAVALLKVINKQYPRYEMKADQYAQYDLASKILNGPDKRFGLDPNFATRDCLVSGAGNVYCRNGFNMNLANYGLLQKNIFHYSNFNSVCILNNNGMSKLTAVANTADFSELPDYPIKSSFIVNFIKDIMQTKEMDNW